MQLTRRNKILLGLGCVLLLQFYLVSRFTASSPTQTRPSHDGEPSIHIDPIMHQPQIPVEENIPIEDVRIHPNEQRDAALQLIKRVLPSHQHLFTVEIIDQLSITHGYFDAFEIETGPGNNEYPHTIILRGSSGVAIASAFNHYLKYFCHCQLTWGAKQLNIPDPPPRVSKTRIETPHKYRYYMNTCTHGYSAAFWQWNRWEEEIDWMAMNGINAPLMFTGQEYVWSEVYNELQIPIDGLFTGPAFLPWNRMGNLYGWGGPLPRSFIEKQFHLARKILERERMLGMIPILPGYAGYVPPKFKTKHPTSQVNQLWNWGGFPGTLHLNPMDPMFSKIGKLFIEKLIQLFGTNHLYNADPFNEELPPSNEPTYLASVGDAIYSSMKSADPDAVWIMQGWYLLHTARFWQPPQAKALLNAIPKDKLVILDLWAEVYPLWKVTKQFYDHNFVWCMLHNFGGRPGLYGKLPTISGDIIQAKKESGNLMQGIGLTMEAIENNPVVYDLVTDMTWREEQVDIDDWVADYVHRRYGEIDEKAKQAWKLLQDGVYNCKTKQMSGTGAVIAARPYFGINTVSAGPMYLYFDPKGVKQAWKLLLTCESFAKLETYRYDLVDITVQMLAIIGNNMYHNLIKAQRRTDIPLFKQVAKEMKDLMLDMDSILASDGNFLLGKWTRDARAWGSNEEERKLFERNARLQITSWGDPSNEALLQYAYKLWSGLVSDFYLPRWDIFWNQAITSMEKTKYFDDIQYEIDIIDFEKRWMDETKEFPTEPVGDTFAISKKLYEKYASAEL